MSKIDIGDKVLVSTNNKAGTTTDRRETNPGTWPYARIDFYVEYDNGDKEWIAAKDLRRLHV